MEELSPLEPSVAPPYNLIAERLFREIGRAHV